MLQVLEVSRGVIKHSVTHVPLVSSTVYKRYHRPSYENVYLVRYVLVSRAENSFYTVCLYAKFSFTKVTVCHSVTKSLKTV